MTKKNISQFALIILLSTIFLAGCANQRHSENNHSSNSGGHGNSNSGGHSSNNSGGHGSTTVIEDEAHSTN